MINSLNQSVFVVETKKEFKMYLSSAKSALPEIRDKMAVARAH